MRTKIWFKYFTYIFAIIVTAILGQYILIRLENLRKTTYVLYPYLGNLIMFVFCAAIGFITGLEYFSKEKRKAGKWEVNIPKLVLVGIPSLYFSLYVFVLCFPVSFIRDILSRPIKFFLNGNMIFINIFQFMFGHMIATSLYKAAK